MDEPAAWLATRDVDQIGIVVADLDRALATYSELWPGHRWSCYEHGPKTIPRMTFRGRPAAYSFRAAFGTQTPQVELIQPSTGRATTTSGSTFAATVCTTSASSFRPSPRSSSR